MIFLSRIKLRGFKSFKNADIALSRGFICLAGPNGSGKSNVTDAIRFALGESALRSLRAKKVSELINTSSKHAEVTLYIDGDKKMELKRAIKDDGKNGKCIYRINGKRATRTSVIEALRPLALEVGSHNIIAQGQVQHIIELNAKERRQIIDTVAGISEFEEKKKEAMNELEKVERKISDSNIVLSERVAYLGELEKERDAALAYNDATEKRKSARYTIVKREHEHQGKQHTEVSQKYIAAKAEREKLAESLAALDSKVSSLEAKRAELSAKANAQNARDGTLKQIEQLKVEISAAAASLTERKKDLSRIDSRLKEIAVKKEGQKKKVQQLSAEISRLKAQLKELDSKISALESAQQKSGGSKLSAIRSKLDSLVSTLQQSRESRASLSSDISKSKEMLTMRLSEIQSLSSSLPKLSNEKLEGEKSNISSDMDSIAKEIDKLFSGEKELNKNIPLLDRRMLELKEKHAILRASVSASATNPAISSVLEMRSSIKGIYGTVADLIKFEPEYSRAIEACAGNRLTYLIVESLDVATAAIERLKSQKSGRCTFIPLDRPQSAISADSNAASKSPNSLGLVLDYVSCDRKYFSAMSYVFGDTLLVKDVASAKKVGIGKARMTTLDGELLERSGIITGGSAKSSILSKSALQKLESDIDCLKKEREGAYSELYSIREAISKKRREKAELELKAKGIELEIGSMEAQKKSIQSMKDKIASVQTGAESLKQQISQKEKELLSLNSQIEKMQQERESLSASIATEEQTEQKEEDAHAQELRSFLESRSEFDSSIKTKEGELSLLREQDSELETERKGLLSEHASSKKQAEELIAQSEKNSKLLSQKEEELTHLSASMQKIFAQLKALEADLSGFSAERGKLQFSSDALSRQLSDLEAKKSILESKLADYKVELESFGATAPSLMDAPKTQLEELIKESDAKITSLGAVNLKAPELYEEKKKDIAEVQSKLALLGDEKTAVMHMIEEIDAKKRDIFLSTFNGIAANFRKLFNLVFKGEGSLLLEQPSDPFNSGLQIKVRDALHERYIDSMSGGEKSLLALLFIFSIQMHKASPFYILDEADAALDKENSRKLAGLIRQLSSNTQFVVVSHNDAILSSSDIALGVMKTDEGSKIVGIQLTTASNIAKVRKVPED